MEPDHLTELWQKREAHATAGAPDDVARIAERFRAWRGKVRRRDYRESAAAIVCMLIFARFAVVLPSAVARAAAVFLVLTSAVTVVMLIWANPGRWETDKSAAVRGFCENELRRIDAQIRLLLTVPLWCVGPILVGVDVIFAALSPRLLWTLLYVLVSLILGAVVSYLNRYAVRRYLMPIRNELERILGEES